MTEEELGRVREPLVSLPQGVLSQDGDEFWPYATNSPAAKEAAALDDEAVRNVLLRAKLPLMSAGDHMKALERVLSPPVLPASPWTIARTILEATARASWLLAPEISGKERVARALVLEYQESRELPRRGRALKFASNLQDVEQIPAWSQEIITTQAKNLGIACQTGKSGRLSSIGDTSTSIGAKDIVRDELDEELYYRVLSGAEHQEFWALEFLSGTDVAGSEGYVRQFSMRSEQYWSLVKFPIWWYGIASWRYFSYVGFDLGRLEATLSKAGQVGDLPERYWEKLRPHPQD